VDWKRQYEGTVISCFCDATRKVHLEVCALNHAMGHRKRTPPAPIWRLADPPVRRLSFGELGATADGGVHPMARRTLLTGDDRHRLFDPPVTDREVARHHTLSPDDLEWIDARHGPSTQLGAAVQTALLRRPWFRLAGRRGCRGRCTALPRRPGPRPALGRRRLCELAPDPHRAHRPTAFWPRFSPTPPI
jgi:hypothetical protein